MVKHESPSCCTEAILDPSGHFVCILWHSQSPAEPRREVQGWVENPLYHVWPLAIFIKSSLV